MKLLSKLLFLCLCFYYVQKFCTLQTGGFTLLNIQSDLTFQPKWKVENAPLDPRIFEQKFHYLGAGGQCYAFASEDGRYVLKFFKHHLRRLPLWLKYLPLQGDWGDKKRAQLDKRLCKLDRDFNSYVLAKELLPDETGLLYVHLNKGSELLPHAHIVDKLNITHTLALDQVEFILQKRASLAYPHLLSLIKNGKIEEGKKALDSIVDLILSRCQKGVYDDDAKIHRNFGFIHNQAILIDVGRLKCDEKRKQRNIQKQDLKQITERLIGFLNQNSPELAHYLNEKIDAL